MGLQTEYIDKAIQTNSLDSATFEQIKKANELLINAINILSNI